MSVATVYLPREVHSKLRAEARKRGVSVSNLIKELVEEFLEAGKTPSELQRDLLSATLKFEREVAARLGLEDLAHEFDQALASLGGG